MFITLVESVYCAVRTGSLYKTDYVSSLEGQWTQLPGRSPRQLWNVRWTESCAVSYRDKVVSARYVTENLAERFAKRTRHTMYA